MVITWHFFALIKQRTAVKIEIVIKDLDIDGFTGKKG